MLHAAPLDRLEADFDRDERLEAARLPVAGVDHVVVEGDVGPPQTAGLAGLAGSLDELRLQLLALPVEITLGAGEPLGLACQADRPQGKGRGQACHDGDRTGGDQVQRGAHGGRLLKTDRAREVYDRAANRQKGSVQ